MNNQLRREIPLGDNHFIIEFKDDAAVYLIQAYPFMAFEIERSLAEDLIVNRIPIEDVIDEQEPKQNLFTTPGIFYQPILIMTNRCNLRCKYCYADSGSYGFDGYCDMDRTSIKNTVCYVQRSILKHRDHLSGQHIELAYVAFGGESLINLDGVLYLLECAKESCQEMSAQLGADVQPLVIINTNGLLITDDLLRLLEPDRQNIEFVVSLDGLYHDENRLDYSGHGSLERTVRGIEKLKKFGFDFYVTCCLIPDHLDITAENVRYIRSVIGKDKQINLSFIRGAIENVKDCVSYPGVLQQSYTQEKVETYANDIVQLIREDENIYCNKFLRRAQAGGFRNKCAACLYEFCVIADGSIYPCHNFIQDDYRLGNINDGDVDITKTKQYQKFLSRDMNSLSPCRTCCLKSICISSFDCPAHSEHDLHDFNRVDALICEAGKAIQLALLQKMLKNGGKIDGMAQV